MSTPELLHPDRVVPTVTARAVPDGGDPLRMMTVHAHPDDESSKGAATCARYVAEGRRGHGRHLHRRRARQHPQPRDEQAGRPGRHAGHPARRRWPAPRRSSAWRTAGSASSTPGCPRATRCRRCPRAASRSATWTSRSARWSRWSGEFRPHVMITYDESGGYPHPDHIRCHEVSVAAFDAAGDPDALPGRRRAVAAAEAVLLRTASPAPAWRRSHDGAAGSAASSRRSGSGSRTGRRTRRTRARG